MIAKLRSWGRKIKQHPLITTGIILLFALIAFTFAVYKFGWDWTGFIGGESKITITSTSKGITTAKEMQPGKTFWDWLQLLGVLAIPVVVGFGTAFFTRQQAKTSEANAETQQQEEFLRTYFDKISDLLLDKELNTNPNIQSIVRARTLAALHILNTKRKAIVLRFLHDSNLLQYVKGFLYSLDLSNTDLNRIDLSQAVLSETNLSGADLSWTNLSQAVLSETNLSGANLTGADLSGANLRETNLSGADLGWTNLSQADLSRANLSRANLFEADLSQADLSEADLSEADLRSVIGITIAKLEKQAKSLKGATMPDGSKHQ